MLTKIMNNGKDIWLNNIKLNQMPQRPKPGERVTDPISTIRSYGERGWRSIISDYFFDVWDFIQYPEKVEELTKAGYLKLEFEDTPEDFVKNGRFWTAYVQRTGPASSFEEAAKQLPYRSGLMELYRIAKQYGFSKKTWLKEIHETEPLNKEFREHLGLNVWSSMTDVLEACNGRDRELAMFTRYNDEWNNWLSKRHGCKFTLEANGEVKQVV